MGSKTKTAIIPGLLAMLLLISSEVAARDLKDVGSGGGSFFGGGTDGLPGFGATRGRGGGFPGYGWGFGGFPGYGGFPGFPGPGFPGRPGFPGPGFGGGGFYPGRPGFPGPGFGGGGLYPGFPRGANFLPGQG